MIAFKEDRAIRGRVPRLEAQTESVIGQKRAISARRPTHAGLVDMTQNRPGFWLTNYTTAPVHPRHVTRLTFPTHQMIAPRRNVFISDITQDHASRRRTVANRLVVFREHM